MTDEKLREQLAKKLSGPRGGIPLDHEDWLELADECLRQIKWFVAGATITNIPYVVPPGTIRAEFNAKLSLAPDDWSPDA